MIWVLATYLPFFVSFVMLAKRLRTGSRQLLCLAATLPAFWVAFAAAEAEAVIVPWLFFEAHFGLDVTRRIFLAFTALLWLAAGLYAGSYLKSHPRQRFFYFLYLLTMSGNFGLILAEDIPSFYTFFALMTFAAYGLVVFDGSERAYHAGRVYIVMAILGEAMLLAAIVLTAHTSGSLLLADAAEAVAVSPMRNLIIALAFGGFGVKAGVAGLHMWLPLAHPVAPTPASAVLSGAMIKAGLLGWIHFLPLGHYESDVWSSGIILLGLAAAFGGVAVGVMQFEPKTILAYSSISQMGVMTTAVGVGLNEPAAWPTILAVVSIYALGHAFAKGTLFLGVGIAHAARGRPAQLFTMAGLLVAAAAVAGAPMTGGAVSKKALKGIISFAPGTWPGLLEWLLPLSAIATTVLLGRFLYVLREEIRHDYREAFSPGLWWSWVLSLGLVAVGAWVAVPYFAIEVDVPGFVFADAWDGIWPVAAGGVLLWAWWRYFRRESPKERVPAGDLVVPIEAVYHAAKVRWRASRAYGPESWEINLEPFVASLVESERKHALMSRIEKALGRWNIAGVWYLLLLLAIVGILFLERF